MDFQKDLIAEFQRETGRTRKMFEAIPADADMNYKPHPKSMPLGRLAGHIADMTNDWAMHTLTQEKMDLPADFKFEAYIPVSGSAAAEKLDAGVKGLIPVLNAMTPEKWDQHWKFIFGGQTFIDQPRHEVFRELVISHMVHHRAQLGVYLRLMGAKIPGLYGPSADEAM
jgi:uncharacterized damage-inducible protein DinB